MRKPVLLLSEHGLAILPVILADIALNQLHPTTNDDNAE